MKYKLPRQIVDTEIIKIISREIRKQDLPITRASPKRLKEIAEISHVIKRWGLPQNLLCKKLPRKLGHGIFLKADANPILRGQIIAPYSGETSITPQNKSDDTAYAFSPVEEMHLTKEEQLFYDKKNRYHPRRLYSFKLDALKKGNFTRFINHSEKPNIVACVYSVPRANSYDLAPMPIEIIYMAKRTIHPGEQLLISYEDGEENCYWGAFNIKPYPMTPKTFQVSASGKVIRTTQ